MTNPAPSPDHAEMAELLPCPFCGESPKVTHDPDMNCDWMEHHCDMVYADLYEHNWDKWNRRAPSESSPEGCERLQNCKEIGPGHGVCDHCAEGRPEFCRYTMRQGTVNAIDALRQQVAELREKLEKSQAAYETEWSQNEVLRTRAESAELTNQQLAEKCLRLVAENDLLSARTADGVQAGAAKLGRKLFEFTSFMDWMNHAKARFEKHCGGMCSTDYVCVDAAGFICARGGQFMRARDQERYPVSVYSIEPLSNPTPKST